MPAGFAIHESLITPQTLVNNEKLKDRRDLSIQPEIRRWRGGETRGARRIKSLIALSASTRREISPKISLLLRRVFHHAVWKSSPRVQVIRGGELSRMDPNDCCRAATFRSRLTIWSFDLTRWNAKIRRGKWNNCNCYVRREKWRFSILSLGRKIRCNNGGNLSSRWFLLEISVSKLRFSFICEKMFRLEREID